ncbi:CHASE2 domain-containing protein [Acidobacteriia bacterium AH_259_A11_L15]|nr:CHASE2 domain-containing protein [Acidobacteriia bacterium AH_259_A11_L15]
MSNRYSFLISLFLTLLGLALYAYTFLAEARTPLAQFSDSIELKTYDTRFRLRGPVKPSPEIVIVAIDQKTLDDLGSWPYSRLHYARMLDYLAADGAAVVGFDLVFPKEQEADTDAQFADALHRASNPVLAQFFFNPEEVEHIDEETRQAYEDLVALGAFAPAQGLRGADGTMPPPLAEIYTGLEGYLPQPNLPEFTEAVDYNVGHFNFVTETDAIFRRANLVIRYKDDFYPSLDVQMLRRYLDVPEREFGLFYNKAGVEYVQFGELRVPTDLAGRMVINYQGPAYTYRHVSLSDVAAGNFPPGTFSRKIVLVGWTAIGTGTVFPVPVQEAGFPGVEIHANVLDTMLTQRFIHRGIREELIDMGLILLFGLGMGWVLARVPLAYLIPVATLVLAVFLGFTYFVFSHFRVWLNIVLPAAVLVTNLASVTSFRLLLKEREKSLSTQNRLN